MPLIQLILTYKYFILVPVALFEGPIVTMTAGFLVRLGYLDAPLAYACLFTGDLLGDIMWYCIGRFVGARAVHVFGKYVGITPEGVHAVEKIFYRHTHSILFISKITMGFGFALVTLLTAGIIKIPFRTFFAANFFGQLLWTGGLMAIGFFFGHFYLTVNSVLGRASAVALFVVACALVTGFGKFIRARTLKNQLV